MRRGVLLLGLAGTLAWAPGAQAAEGAQDEPVKETVKTVVTPEGEKVTVTVRQKERPEPEPQIVERVVEVPVPADEVAAAPAPQKAGCPWRRVQTEAKISSEETETGAVIRLDANSENPEDLAEARAAAERIADKMNQPCPNERQQASEAAPPAG